MESNLIHVAIKELMLLGWEIEGPDLKDPNVVKNTYVYSALKNYSRAIAYRKTGKEAKEIELICEFKDVITDKSDQFIFPTFRWKK